MDGLNVPKKVNRHVMKAVNYLSNGNPKERISTALILNQVKYQMRNLVPVPNIDMAIQKSLKNLTDIGVIERVGPQRYALGRKTAAPPPQAKAPGRERFKAKDPRKRSHSQLDPNRNRTYSKESLSGDEIDRTRKRLRTNAKQLKRSGCCTELPKARQHDRHSENYVLDNHLSPPVFSGIAIHSDTVIDQDHMNNYEFYGNMGSIRNSNMNINLPTRSLGISKISNDISNSLDNLQFDDAIRKESQVKIIELYKDKSNIEKFKNSDPNIATISTETLSSHNVTVENSKSVVESKSKQLLN